MRVVGHRSNVAWTLWGIAALARQQKDPARARAAHQEALSLLREDGGKREWVGTILDLSDLERSLGNFDQAKVYLTYGLQLLKRRGWTQSYGYSLRRLATLLLESGSYVRGVRLAATVSLDALVPIYYVNLSEDLANHEAAIQTARVSLGEEAFAAAWDEGLAMTLDGALAEALSEGSDD